MSDKGKELGLMILALMQWGDKHLKDGVAAIDVKDRKTGEPLEVALVHKGAATTPLSDVAIKPRVVSGETP